MRDTTMRLSKTAYYADFAIYALVVAALAGIAESNPEGPARLRWLEVFLGGAILWTLVEYLLHRFVLHRWRAFTTMHALHHAAPRDFIGTPTWITLGTLWLVFFLPEWRLWSFNAASGLVAGVMTGFLWYGMLHHIIHHGRPRAIALLLTRSAYRHRQHHYSGRYGNFGVTTAIWDHLFGTVIKGPVRRPITSAVTGPPDRYR